MKRYPTTLCPRRTTMTTDEATAFVATLARRGITLHERGKRLEIRPKQAYGLLSVDERQTLKRDRDDIIAVVHAGSSVLATATPAGRPVTPTSVPAPDVCSYCHRKCVGA